MNTDLYYIPAGPVESELRVANSRFIASLAPVFNVYEARAFHKSIKQRFPDATHHVPAFVIGHGKALLPIVPMRRAFRHGWPTRFSSAAG